MIKNFFLYLKIIFYVANIVLISLYIFPGSILGWLIYRNAGLQPQITPDFYVSSNHVYAFMLLSILGYFAYRKENLNFVFVYLVFISIFLEVLHFFIPNRGFEFPDLFGNILGVLMIYFYHLLHKYFVNSANEK